MVNNANDSSNFEVHPRVCGQSKKKILEHTRYVCLLNAEFIIKLYWYITYEERKKLKLHSFLEDLLY